MNLALVQSSDGNFIIVSEHGTDLEAAIKKFHTQSAALWNDKDTTRAVLMIVDENWNQVGHYKEEIAHGDAAPVE